MSAVDDYFAEQVPAARAAFQRIRAIAVAAAPDAEDGVSYGMPALRYRGKPLLGFRAAKDHLSVFPFSPAVVAAVRDRLAGFDLSKGTVRFSAGRPLPEDVVRDLVRLRLSEIDGGAG